MLINAVPTSPSMLIGREVSVTQRPMAVVTIGWRLWTLHMHYRSAYGFIADTMRQLRLLNDPHQCRGIATCHPSCNADLTPPLYKRSQAVVCCVGAGW